MPEYWDQWHNHDETYILDYLDILESVFLLSNK